MLKKKRTQVMLACLSLVILGLCLWVPEAVSANTNGEFQGEDETIFSAVLGFIFDIIRKIVGLFR
ncbi:hypothetical protein [Streptococcus halichoeri]|uniref:hypothetical protein n=1 Tax=Streptococcus halichoeri TaxID=254785 RepID=UPI001C8EF6B9|nr:hypothetical protein [Streptococcus halichoeri]